MIKKILKFLSDTFYEKKDDSLDADKFETFESIDSKNKIFAVDGGSGIVFDGGGWIISKIKIGATCYKEGKRISENSDEYFLSVVDSKAKRIVKIFPEVELKLTKSSIDELPNEARDILEKKKIEKLSKEISNEDIILTDGLFEGINGKNLVAVCKTSRLRTESGRSLIGKINELSEKRVGEKKWMYPLTKNTFIVKFHGKSDFCYKVSLSNPKKAKWFLGATAHYSNDPEITGYPYPLLRIDKVVRLREDEKKMTNQKIKALAKQLGKGIEKDEMSTVMHSLLDERAYR